MEWKRAAIGFVLSLGTSLGTSLGSSLGTSQTASLADSQTASLASSGVAPAQAGSPEYKDAEALLAAVAKVYATDAPSFHIESTVESEMTQDLSRNWQKSTLSAVKETGGRFRIETHSSLGNWLQVSDGTTEWTYLKDAKAFTKRPAEGAPHFPQTIGMGIAGLRHAWEIQAFLLADMARAKGATMLPAETIVMEGHRFSCYVVHAEFDGHGFRGDQTFWIEKGTLLLRKKVQHEETSVLVSPILKIPGHQDETTLYPVVEFREQGGATLFSFTPPAEAEEVATLEPVWKGAAASMAWPVPKAGTPLPDIALPGADGRPVKLSSLKGRPLLIDIWANWCASCVEWMPTLRRVATEMQHTGLQVVSVDQDEDAQTARRYLAAHSFSWLNLHDAEGTLLHAVGSEAIPLTLLVDAQGRIAYADLGGDEAKLRAAIRALAPPKASMQ